MPLECFVNSGKFELAVVLPKQFVLNPTYSESPLAQRENQPLLTIKHLLCRRLRWSPAMTFEAIKPMLLIAPPPEAKGGARNAALETDEAGVLCFLVKLDPTKTKCNLLVHPLSIERMSMNRTFKRPPTR